MPILASEALFRENKKNQLQNSTLVSIEPLDLWFQVQHAPLYINLAFACNGLFTLPDSDSDPCTDPDTCTMQKFHIGSDPDSDSEGFPFVYVS